MSKFTFVCQEEAMPFASSVECKRTTEFEADTLNQLLNEFEMFLRGCGYYFKGTLDIVDYDEQSLKEELDSIQPPEINFDFSDIPQNNWPFQNESIKPLTTSDLENFKMEMPGTLGGAKFTFASEK